MINENRSFIKREVLSDGVLYNLFSYMLTSDGFWMLYIIYLIMQELELQWDFDGFSELNLTVNLIFKRKKMIPCNDKGSVDFFLSMTKKHTCRLRAVLHFSFLLYLRYIFHVKSYSKVSVWWVGPILIEIVLDFRKYLF